MAGDSSLKKKKKSEFPAYSAWHTGGNLHSSHRAALHTRNRAGELIQALGCFVEVRGLKLLRQAKPRKMSVRATDVLQHRCQGCLPLLTATPSSPSPPEAFLSGDWQGWGTGTQTRSSPAFGRSPVRFMMTLQKLHQKKNTSKSAQIHNF